jgi:hypothetical protein
MATRKKSPILGFVLIAPESIFKILLYAIILREPISLAQLHPECLISAMDYDYLFSLLLQQSKNCIGQRMQNVDKKKRAAKAALFIIP